MRYYLSRSSGDKGVHTFSKDIRAKVNVMVRQGFELAYYDVTVQHVNHYVISMFQEKM